MSMFNEVLKNVDGSEIVENGKPIKVKDVLVSALLNAPSDKNDSDKLDRYKLSLKINSANEETKLDIDELSMLKRLVLQSMTILVAGQVCELLEENK